MAIDFEIPDEVRRLREKVRYWVSDVCVPGELRLIEGEALPVVLADLRASARAEGLWCPFAPKAYGGMGLGPLANAVVQMELSASALGALATNSQGPDDATILTLIAHGTEDQKDRFLTPLLKGEKRICYSMTEKAAGADAAGMRTSAVKQEDEYVLNGEKWFTTGARGADLAVVMARTDPEAPRREQFSTFIVELPNPGFRIVREIATMVVSDPVWDKVDPGHAEVKIRDLAVPAANLLGGRGQGFAMGQHRLAYGRLRHGMHNVAMAQRALDLAADHVSRRVTFGEPLGDRQAVQWMLARCASELYMARLMLLHIAYKAERGEDLRQENSIAKVFLAHMVHRAVDTAIQLHGALGYSTDTPLARWYTEIRAQRIVDGPDEVHQWTVGRNVLKAYEAFGTTAPAAGGELI
jgi:acyl-CoA dehydrogenase